MPVDNRERQAPLVSIVTPCLNPGSWLARCLDSVSAQTYPHVEHLVVDGGSSDGTVALLQERGIAYSSEPDSGQTEAINKGFARARGDWLGWLNADDVLTPRAIELAVEAIDRTPAAGWVYGNCELRRDDERLPFASPPARIGFGDLAKGNAISQPGSFVARWALDLVGPLDEDLHLVMDYDLWLRLVDAGVSSAYVPDVTAVFEVHDESKTGARHFSEFTVEMGLSLLKNGHPAGGAAMLGRAAAEAAAGAGNRIDRTELENEIARVRNLAVGVHAEVDVRAVRAGAYAEAAERELSGSPRGFRYLFCPASWRVRTSRNRLLSTLAGAAVNRLTKPVR